MHSFIVKQNAPNGYFIVAINADGRIWESGADRDQTASKMSSLVGTCTALPFRPHFMATLRHRKEEKKEMFRFRITTHWQKRWIIIDLALVQRHDVELTFFLFFGAESTCTWRDGVPVIEIFMVTCVKHARRRASRGLMKISSLYF